MDVATSSTKSELQEIDRKRGASWFHSRGGELKGTSALSRRNGLGAPGVKVDALCTSFNASSLRGEHAAVRAIPCNILESSLAHRPKWSNTASNSALRARRSADLTCKLTLELSVFTSCTYISTRIVTADSHRESEVVCIPLGGLKASAYPAPSSSSSSWPQ